MYYFYGKVVRGHVVCPLYGGCLYLRGYVMGGSTVFSKADTVRLAKLSYRVVPMSSKFLAFNIACRKQEGLVC